MWAELFGYEYAIFRNTLFIRGIDEQNPQTKAFSLPVGEMPADEAVRLLSQWCRSRGERLKLSAVPEYALATLAKLKPARVTELEGWGDYLYDAATLATLSGKKMAKKRNHVNQFIKLYGENCFEPVSRSNLADVEEFMERICRQSAPTPSAAMERQLAMKLLRESEQNLMHFFGGLLRINGKVEAFTIGDIKGDTLFIHIEKANREIAGCYEMINRTFARHMTHRFPEIKFINREDDSGDEGLRQSKMSYHPIEILSKFTVEF